VAAGLSCGERPARSRRKPELQLLQIFKQSFLFFVWQLRTEIVTTVTIAGIPVVAIGRIQCVVKFGLFSRQPNIHRVVGRPNLECAYALRRRLEQFIQRRNRAIVQVRRCRPNALAGSKMKCNTVVMLSVEALYGQRIQAVSG
jgi:hypothetical protein